MAILSLIISIFLWLVAQSERMETSNTFQGVPLELRGLPEELVALNEKGEAIGEKGITVKLIANGPKEAIEKIDAGELKPFVDLSRAGPITKKFPVQLDGLQRYKDKGVEWTLPFNQLTIDTIAKRDFRVNVVRIGTLKDQRLRLKGVTVAPERVTVSGPSTIVKKVYSAQAYLDLNAPPSDLSQDKTIDLLDKTGVEVNGVNCDPKAVTLRISLAPADQSVQLVVDPVFSGTQPEFGYKLVRYSVTPSQVVVGGSSDALTRLRAMTIPTKPIDLAGLTKSATISVDLDSSQLRGVHPLSATSVKVHVQIEPVLTPIR